MRKAIILLFIVFACLMSVAAAQADLKLPPLPKLALPEPPDLVPIPDTHVYAAPDVDVDLFFFEDAWYRPHEGMWFRATVQNGAWVRIKTVPSALKKIPPGHRGIIRGQEKFKFKAVKQNWKKWAKEKKFFKKVKSAVKSGVKHGGDGGKGKGKGKKK